MVAIVCAMEHFDTYLREELSQCTVTISL
jgi:hypothetical protein